MPKIIENLPQLLADEARRQIEESGFSAMTVRSVAKKCGVGVGTVYNYYPSKEALVATFMLEDWKVSIEMIQRVSEESQTPRAVLQTMYDQLLLFIRQYDPIFRDSSANPGYTGPASPHHKILRDQLAAPVRKFCPDDFTAQFVAEAMLTWTLAGASFDTLFGIVGKLF